IHEDPRRCLRSRWPSNLVIHRMNGRSDRILETLFSLVKISRYGTVLLWYAKVRRRYRLLQLLVDHLPTNYFVWISIAFGRRPIPFTKSDGQLISVGGWSSTLSVQCRSELFLGSILMFLISSFF